MKTFGLKIVTPETLLLEAEVTGVTLPMLDGEVTLLADHEAYMGVCKPGEVIIKQVNGETENFATSGGLVEFRNNALVVLADTAEAAGDIDAERAEQAKKRAEELMAAATMQDDEAYERTAALLERELVRLKVHRKHASKYGVTNLSE